MAIAALATMFFDPGDRGVYALVGFEVTPATVIGLLTILGFSLYDTVIVFDKVEENTHGFGHTTRRTFRRAGQPGGQPDLHAIDQHQPHLAAADHRADRRRGLAAGCGHAEGPRAGPAGRHHRRYLSSIFFATRCWSPCANAPNWCAPTPAASSSGGLGRRRRSGVGRRRIGRRGVGHQRCDRGAGRGTDHRRGQQAPPRGQAAPAHRQPHRPPHG